MSKKITYLSRTLSADEEILAVAEIHWFAYVPSVFFIFIGVCMSPIWNGDPTLVMGIWILLVILGILNLLSVMKTEIICTNKRVISKKGIISVKTEELRDTKVESISIQQSFFGRMFDYSEIVFCGTGATKIKCRYIADPILIKSKFESIIEEAQAKSETK